MANLLDHVDEDAPEVEDYPRTADEMAPTTLEATGDRVIFGERRNVMTREERRAEMIRRRWKTMLAAVLMVLAGAALVIFGILDISLGLTSRGVSLIIVASLLLLPGVYQSHILWGAFNEAPGYHFNAVPSWDD